jgi:hypothetical protein
MGIKLQGGNDSTNLTSVTALNQLRVTTPLAGVCAGFIQASTEEDSGTSLGSRTVVAFEASDDYRLRSGIDQTIFNTTFEGTVLQTPTWFQSLSVMTTQVVNGFVALNAGLNTAAASVAYIRTYRTFPVYGTYPTYVDMWVREANMDSTNTISEWGLIYTAASATQQLPDAICFRRTSGGQLRAAIVNNTIDVKEQSINTEGVPARNGIGNYDPTQSNHYLIVIMNDVIHFWINDTLVAKMDCPSAQAYFSSASALPVGFRVLNLAATSIARQISIGYVNVGLGDQNTNKPWSHVMSGMGQGAYQTQVGSAVGPTVTRSAVGSVGHPNSATVRIAGSWAAQSGPNLNSLGGLWTSPAMSTLTSDADYPIFSYLNPVGTAALPGKTLYVTGIRVGETNVTVGATGGGGMFLSYIAMPEASASSTGTTDSATSTSGKSIVLGGQGFPTGEAVGTMKPGFEISFPSPIVLPASKYLHIVVRPFGTILANTLVVTGSVAVNGYHE